jgi:2',5'-phosphodiesterase
VDDWQPELKPLRSAYVEANKSEPDFTNYAKVQDDPPFIDTLDYIFLSKQWAVEHVKQLPHRDQAMGPLPNDQEPSDHMLIAANLYLRS